MPWPPDGDADGDLRRLHDEVDAAAAALAARHAGRIRCARGCASCCLDGLTVFAVEADRIRRAHPALLRDGVPHPPGACAFLDGAGACRIYADRPYVCRTQGLPLRWTEDDGEGGGIEYRDVCPLNDVPGDAPVETLAAVDCWTIGPFEARLRAVQARADPDAPRVPLRALFANATAPD